MLAEALKGKSFSFPAASMRFDDLKELCVIFRSMHISELLCEISKEFLYTKTERASRKFFIDPSAAGVQCHRRCQSNLAFCLSLEPTSDISLTNSV